MPATCDDTPLWTRPAFRLLHQFSETCWRGAEFSGAATVPIVALDAGYGVQY